MGVLVRYSPPECCIHTIVYEMSSALGISARDTTSLLLNHKYETAGYWNFVMSDILKLENDVTMLTKAMLVDAINKHDQPIPDYNVELLAEWGL